MRLRVEVPATSANLGPGFDCFGLALDLCNEVTLQTGGDQAVTWAGEGAGELPTDGSDLISRTIVTIAEAHGKVLPSFALHGVNRIPLERGLGSSSAAAVAGVLLASALLQLPIHGDPHAVFAVSSSKNHNFGFYKYNSNSSATADRKRAGSFKITSSDSGEIIKRITITFFTYEKKVSYFIFYDRCIFDCRHCACFYRTRNRASGRQCSTSA